MLVSEEHQSVTNLYPQGMLEDLAKSGLLPTDIKAKPLTAAEKAATGAPLGVEGYVIPYFDITGRPLPFYRVKLFGTAAKYRQLLESPNHVYFPPRLIDVLGKQNYLIVTEGEKKAAAAVKAGFPCIALGGVDNWKSRNINLPKESAIAQKPSGQLTVRLPSGGAPSEEVGILATGLAEVINYVSSRKIPILLAFDTDALPNGRFGVKPEVQRAAAVFGYELRHRGVPLRNIRQLILPSDGTDKVGLDDLLGPEGLGAPELSKCIAQNLKLKSAFPRHPNVKEFVNRKLQKTQLVRSDQTSLAIAILSDLDARGQRLRAPDEQLYYFSDETKALTKVDFSGRPEFSDAPFGRYLYQQYNIGLADQRIMLWLGTQFAAEDPISEVRPEKVMTWRGDTLYYQINNGTTARVTKDQITLIDNGVDNVLFESGLIEEIPTADFDRALKVAATQPVENWWYHTLKDTRIKDSADDRQRQLLSLLYYVSPTFYRWRGTQLPVEITTGEAGSGKSTLFEFRLSVLTGVPTLRNAPSDLKDWSASLATTGALHVTDNVQLTDNGLRQRLSDEICRLVTEPSPSIEQRKLYTNTGIVKIPVSCVFGITAIKQPFQNIDIIQRSIITVLDKGTDVDLKYDMEWKAHQLEQRGGRAQWLVHQLVFAQRILQLVASSWEPRYQARFRLINLEQLLQLAATVVGWDSGWIAPHLESSRDKRAAETDWALEGLVAFAENWRRKNPGAYEVVTPGLNVICGWAEGEDDFAECNILTNPRMLSRYIEQHKHTVSTTANVTIETGADRHQVFRVRRPK